MDLKSRRFINEKFGLKVLQKAGYQGIRWPSLVVIIFWTHFVGPRMAWTLSLKFWLTYLSRKTYTNKYKHPLFGYGHSNGKYWILLLPCEYIDHVGEQKIKTLILQSFQYIFVLVKMFRQWSLKIDYSLRWAPLSRHIPNIYDVTFHCDIS